MKIKCKIPIGKLFDFFGQLNSEYDIPIKINRYLAIQTQYNEFKNINYLIRKRGQVNTYVLDTDIKIKCDENHLIRENNKFINIKNATSVDTIYGNKRINNIIPDKVKDVYDFSINSPHEYITSQGIISHNTTLAKILTKNMDCDELYINASDETGVDVVRDRIKPFAASVSFAKIKVVILDEFDYMSPNSQAALRNTMEQFHKLTRFILTCNYHEKIIEPIVSRCQVYGVVPPSRKDVAIHVAKILQKESVKFNPEDIKVLVDSTYPDVRQLVNSCQRNSIEGTLVVNRAEIIDSDFKLKLLGILTQKEKRDIFKSVRQLVADNYVSDFTEVYRFLYDKVEDIASDKVPHVITILADGLKYDTFIVDKEINFMSTMINLITEL